jgi:hypothetical protein
MRPRSRCLPTTDSALAHAAARAPETHGRQPRGHPLPSGRGPAIDGVRHEQPTVLSSRCEAGALRLVRGSQLGRRRRRRDTQCLRSARRHRRRRQSQRRRGADRARPDRAAGSVGTDLARRRRSSARLRAATTGREPDLSRRPAPGPTGAQASDGAGGSRGPARSHRPARAERADRLDRQHRADPATAAGHRHRRGRRRRSRRGRRQPVRPWPRSRGDDRRRRRGRGDRRQQCGTQLQDDGRRLPRQHPSRQWPHAHVPAE